MLKALASNNTGLCVVTTRYSIPDLRNFWQTTGPEIKLSSLSINAGVALLRRLGVKGSQAEVGQLVRDVKGHALTLNLLGSFLRDAHAGDIRKRDLVKLADERTLHCRGMKIDGVKGPAEYEMLRGIIAHCEEEV